MTCYLEPRKTVNKDYDWLPTPSFSTVGPRNEICVGSKFVIFWYLLNSYDFGGGRWDSSILPNGRIIIYTPWLAKPARKNDLRIALINLMGSKI
jgi:hypothetical protein